MVTLRDLRADRLLSIRELAHRASVAPSTIFLIESGRTIPRQRVARQIARALQIDPNEVDEFRRTIDASKMYHSRAEGSRSAAQQHDGTLVRADAGEWGS